MAEKEKQREKERKEKEKLKEKVVNKGDKNENIGGGLIKTETPKITFNFNINLFSA